MSEKGFTVSSDDQPDHNDQGEVHSDPQVYAVQVRAPTVAWTPVDSRGGITWSGSGGVKLCIHTTETRGLPLYPFPPHVTVNLLEPEKIWQHVTGTKGAYALKSAPKSPNYECGPVYQVEHIGYARDTATAPDLFYHSLAREVTWFHRNKGVPLNFAPVWGGGEAYGEWSGRMSPEEFTEFSGVHGHQHVHGNDHWDPGKLDIPRLKDAIDEWMGTTDPTDEEAEMILVEGASGNAVRSLQKALNNWSEANDKGFKVAVDGTWGKGEAMTGHLKTFQEALNLEATGTLDGLTASYLVGRYDPPDI
jgi:Putative peptidoglycan binding domain